MHLNPDMANSPKPEVLSTDRPFEGKIVSVRVDEVRVEDGRVMRQEVVEHRESMTVIAIDAQERIVLVRQYRHPAGDELLETPAGSVDPGETAEQAVNRELSEEVGLCAREVLSIGSFYLAPGWCTEFMHVYLARDLYESRTEPDEDEQIEVVCLPLPEWQAKIDAGEIRDSKSIAAWHLARRHLQG
jgi:8-oxo-dGTP pyrophosphatase MutT (NUDIX family)